MKKSFGLVLLALIAVAVLGRLALGARLAPISQEELAQTRIYAYRDWQSTGVQLHTGDQVTVWAQGTWLYSPVAGYHGPEGHFRFSAPSFYPLPNVRGGALIGRIGEDGSPFYVGKGTWVRAQQDGLLYLCIDDDILSDNDGYVTVKITVVTPTPEN